MNFDEFEIFNFDFFFAKFKAAQDELTRTPGPLRNQVLSSANSRQHKSRSSSAQPQRVVDIDLTEEKQCDNSSEAASSQDRREKNLVKCLSDAFGRKASLSEPPQRKQPPPLAKSTKKTDKKLQQKKITGAAVKFISGDDDGLWQVRAVNLKFPKGPRSDVGFKLTVVTVRGSTNATNLEKMEKLKFDGFPEYESVLKDLGKVDDLKSTIAKGTTYLFYPGHEDNPFAKKSRPMCMVTFHGGVMLEVKPGMPIDYPIVGWAVADYLEYTGSRSGKRIATIRHNVSRLGKGNAVVQKSNRRNSVSNFTVLTKHLERFGFKRQSGTDNDIKMELEVASVKGPEFYTAIETNKNAEYLQIGDCFCESIIDPRDEKPEEPPRVFPSITLSMKKKSEFSQSKKWSKIHPNKFPIQDPKDIHLDRWQVKRGITIGGHSGMTVAFAQGGAAYKNSFNRNELFNDAMNHALLAKLHLCPQFILPSELERYKCNTLLKNGDSYLFFEKDQNEPAFFLQFANRLAQFCIRLEDGGNGPSGAAMLKWGCEHYCEANGKDSLQVDIICDDERTKKCFSKIGFKPDKSKEAKVKSQSDPEDRRRLQHFTLKLSDLAEPPPGTRDREFEEKAKIFNNININSEKMDVDDQPALSKTAQKKSGKSKKLGADAFSTMRKPTTEKGALEAIPEGSPLESLFASPLDINTSPESANSGDSNDKKDGSESVTSATTQAVSKEMEGLALKPTGRGLQSLFF